MWDWARPKNTATAIAAVAMAPDSHGIHGAEPRVRRGRAWVLISGGSWRVRAAAASTRSRISAGASVVAAKAMAVATSRNPRTSLAHDWQRLRWRLNLVSSLRRVQRVEGVGAGERVQVLAEEPHQLTPRQSRIRISPSRIQVLIAPSVTCSNSAT